MPYSSLTIKVGYNDLKVELVSEYGKRMEARVPLSRIDITESAMLELGRIVPRQVGQDFWRKKGPRSFEQQFKELYKMIKELGGTLEGEDE